MKKLATKLFKKLNPPQLSETVFIEELNLQLNRRQHQFFMDGLHFAKSLKEKVGATFYLDENDNVLADFSSFKAAIETQEELYILNEIFIEGTYNFFKNESVVIWDIGMNVGLSSLYFASQKNALVIGYEPFKQTYVNALRNFELNPKLSSQIIPHNYGIGSDNKVLVSEYISEYKGSVGVNGVPEHLKNKYNVTKHQIEIKNVCEVLDYIIDQAEGKSIVAKIDCEGSEYDIIQSLYQAGKLECITTIMMEWHKNGPQHLVDCLEKSGFSVLSFNPHDKNIGMIYATK